MSVATYTPVCVPAQNPVAEIHANAGEIVRPARGTEPKQSNPTPEQGAQSWHLAMELVSPQPGLL